MGCEKVDDVREFDDVAGGCDAEAEAVYHVRLTLFLQGYLDTTR